jgi:hypothetical protein
VTCSRSRALKIVVMMAVIAALSGCADGSSDPGATPLAAGQTCGSIKQELDRLDAKGIRSNVEAVSQGKKVSPAAQAEVDRYNSLLNQYLGARCYV